MIEVLLLLITALLGMVGWLGKKYLNARNDWSTRYAELNRAIDINISRQNSANTHIQSVEHQVVALKGQVIRHEEMFKQVNHSLSKIEDSVKPIAEISEKVAVINDRLEKRA